MSLIQVLVLGDISQDAISKLSSRCELELLPQQQPSPGQLAHAQIIVVRSHVRIDQRLLDGAPELELVVRAGAGLDNVDITALRKRGVHLCHLGGRSSARSVAELALAHTLYLLRQIGIANSGIARGEWLKADLMGEEIYKRRVAVWGFGSIGRCVAELFDKVGAEIRVHNRSGDTGPFTHEPSLANLAKWADVHVLALPHNAETVGLLSPVLLSLMKIRRPIIVNMGRSDISSFGVLVSALEDGVIAGLGIDPLSQDDVQAAQGLALRTDLNTVFTPHLGATTSGTLARMGEDILAAVLPSLSIELSSQARHCLVMRIAASGSRAVSDGQRPCRLGSKRGT
jgi:D-3-phosphoglycerate dehydrogenase